MAMENGKWRVVKGDCLWNISKSVYNTPYKWPDIANANGIRQSNPIIYPGQLLVLPGKSSSTSPSPTNPNNGKSVKTEWFALDSGTDRDMFITWKYDRPDTKNYEVLWEYDTGSGGWRTNGPSTTELKQHSFSAPENAKKVRVSVTPKSDKWTDGVKITKEYNFADNPPGLPSVPDFIIDAKNNATIKLENIDPKINADSIEFAIYQDDNYKYRTGIATINKDTNIAKYETIVDPGHFYIARCRAVRNNNIYGGWTEYTSSDVSTPIAPEKIIELRSQVISEQMSKKYAVFVSWTEVKSAKKYLVEWTTNKELFDTPDVSSMETEEGQGPKILISDLELGHAYYFRVASINDKGKSLAYTNIETVTLGVKPSAPTTYSNVSSCIVGEDLRLYWVHNSLDGSIETYARLHAEIIDSAHPDLGPTIVDKVIKNEKPEEDKNKTSVYIINSNDPEWSAIKDGCILKWKVQTAGVVSEYSNWSIEREVNIYVKPSLTISIQNSDNVQIDEISSFPFYILLKANPLSQIPISYFVEIIANDTYNTVDDYGKKIQVSKGTAVYQKYYDPQTNSWELALEMTPGNINLQPNISYTINATVSMNSGLMATTKTIFNVFLNDLFYDVFADITINHKSLEANIKPYCYEYITENGATKPSLVKNCSLSVYRKNYDGGYVLIKDNVPNDNNTFITDPHPALDYARYRVVAKTLDTGSISFADIKPVLVNEPMLVIQWDEPWEPYKTDSSDNGLIEPDWSGSMLKLPYNIATSESNKVDVVLVNYAGRKRPVSYYGTHLGETSNWNTEIPKYDKETLYALRKLARWTGNVYIRESTGVGYWAHVEVGFNMKYNDLIIPVSISVTRVEGGI